MPRFYFDNPAIGQGLSSLAEVLAPDPMGALKARRMAAASQYDEERARSEANDRAMGDAEVARGMDAGTALAGLFPQMERATNSGPRPGSFTSLQSPEQEIDTSNPLTEIAQSVMTRGGNPDQTAGGLSQLLASLAAASGDGRMEDFVVANGGDFADTRSGFMQTDSTNRRGQDMDYAADTDVARINQAGQTQRAGAELVPVRDALGNVRYIPRDNAIGMTPMMTETQAKGTALQDAMGGAEMSPLMTAILGGNANVPPDNIRVGPGGEEIARNPDMTPPGGRGGSGGEGGDLPAISPDDQAKLGAAAAQAFGIPPAEAGLFLQQLEPDEINLLEQEYARSDNATAAVNALRNYMAEKGVSFGYTDDNSWWPGIGSPEVTRDRSAGPPPPPGFVEQ